MRKILFCILILISFIALSEQSIKRAKKAAKTITNRAKNPFKMTNNIYGQKFESMTGWSKNKLVTIKMDNHKMPKTVFEKNKLQSDFNGQTVNKAADSVFSYHHTVAKFIFQVQKLDMAPGIYPNIILSDFIYEFEPEDPSKVEVLLTDNSPYSTHRSPKTLHDLEPMEKYKQQQEMFIKERGIFSKEEDEENSDMSNYVKRNRWEHVFMYCHADSGLHKIKGRMYPYLLDSPENVIEFYFWKDCTPSEANLHLKIDVNHYCHHHKINEIIPIWKDNTYTEDYLHGDHQESVYIDKTTGIDPTVQISVSQGNQFLLSPTITKIAGPASDNQVEIKRNKMGGFVNAGDAKPFEMIMVCKCRDDVGVEKWELTFDVPPYDEEISIIFKTECGAAAKLTSFTDFPLQITTQIDSIQEKVVEWGITQSNFKVVEDDVFSSTAMTFGQDTSRLVFQYSALREKLDVPAHEIVIHNPVITGDGSVVKVMNRFPKEATIGGETDEENLTNLEVYVQCLKKGEQFIDIHQKFDIPSKNLYGQEIEFGFRKTCIKYDNMSSLRGDKGSNVYFYAMCIILAILFLYALKSLLAKGGKKKYNTQLPTFSTEYNEVPNNTSNVVNRKRVD